MNTTKFRGQILDGPRKGEWVYGNLIQTPTRTYILEAEYEVDFIEPEYHEQGMGCGLEDRNITDRYEAMFHGFERALDKCAENHPPFIEVDPKTVGQYIGKKDKNGKEAYIGDISKSFFGDNIGIIEWHKTNPWIVLRYVDSRNGIYSFDHLSLEAFEIIGNLTDNPDLLTQ